MPFNADARLKKTAIDASRISHRDSAPFIEAAWLYYHDGRNQNEIADQMQVSRASVVNYLSEVRGRGWVRVFLESDVFLGHRLS